MPAIVGLQETKTADDCFPKGVLENKGYFVYVNGIQSYNGVAIISKIEALSSLVQLNIKISMMKLKKYLFIN